MSNNTIFIYKLKKLLRFGIFSLLFFFIIIRFIVGEKFGLPRTFFSLFYGVSIGFIYEITNTIKFYKLSIIIRNLIRSSLLLLSVLIIIFLFRYFNSFYEITNIYIIDISFDKAFILLLVNVLIVTVLIVLFIELENHLGNRFLIDFLTSKYNKPINEDKIVMFLDLKDSTTIAEKIGSEKFVDFINLCLKIMSESIIKNKATILKYVGDEVILTWSTPEGIKNSNCINFYFDYNADLDLYKNDFMEKFGFFPTFKAGVHSGVVTAAFLGSIKKQMDYSGDVMNTTARIESICNKYDADILISGDLYSDLPSKKKFQFTDLGAMELKGKITEVTVYKVELK